MRYYIIGEKGGVKYYYGGTSEIGFLFSDTPDGAAKLSPSNMAGTIVGIRDANEGEGYLPNVLGYNYRNPITFDKIYKERV